MEKKEPLFAEERKRKILELLNENSKLLVPDLCEYFKVSPATIRNDLRELKNSGFLQRTHGGALSIKTKYELDSYQKEVKHLEEKKAIARFAADIVEDSDTILIDTGTTTLEFAKLLSSKKNLTVVTNDIEIARHLETAGDANVILIGGIIRRDFHCTIGPIAINSLRELYVDKAFMGANGISVEGGLTTPDINQAEVKKAMLEKASEVIVLCDSSKFGIKSFAHVAPISRINRIITDSGLDEDELQAFLDMSVDIDLVKV